MTHPPLAEITYQSQGWVSHLMQSCAGTWYYKNMKRPLNELNRVELKLIFEGLDAVRERMREVDGYDLDVEEYIEVVRLQDDIVDAIESRYY